MVKQELIDTYKTALASIAEQDGFDAALTCAAVTLGYYFETQSAGFVRGREPLLFGPEKEVTEE